MWSGTINVNSSSTERVGPHLIDRPPSPNAGSNLVFTLMGLMMEPEGKHRKFIMRQRILAVFGLVDIVMEYTFTMISLQGMIMELEGSDNGAGSLKLHRQTLKVNRGQDPFQAIPTNPNMVRIYCSVMIC
ncbi:hypothetical protein EVAR_63735_1 [Eumeta japonica]|uniref:Uncharacterized protein n=1 Tax=Eumeta variegata TaxID=151549 RepID=A0A4C1ZG08_EUMVA|nr:hypothetical protein EVAR_63735_1 [Eumeta japonica]